ncbi:MAG TPA: beta-propeller fold lactonase family protein [bacterium]|nr:beta-propeller fold lactonase family protein [bacterium]
MPTVVYIACADTREIHVGHLDNAAGTMRVIQKAVMPGVVMPLAVSPNRRLLYACLRSEPFSVATLAIESAAGTLRLLRTAALPDNMAYISTDTTGRFLFGASYSGDRISVSPIDTRGQVEAEPAQILRTASHPHSILTDASNRYLFVPCLGNDVILQYRFDPAAGRLSPNAPPAAEASMHAGPRHLVFDPHDRFAYCTNELDATVGAYRFDPAAGTLTPIGTASLLPEGHQGSPPFAAADIHVRPDGRYLYASERASNTLSTFRIDPASGAAVRVQNLPTEDKPRGFQIDPAGRFLLAVGQVSNQLTSYAIHPDTGWLTPRHRYPMGRNPNWVEIVNLP